MGKKKSVNMLNVDKCNKKKKKRKKKESLHMKVEDVFYG